MTSNSKDRIDRRTFLGSATGAAAGFMIMKSRTALGSQANSALRMGLLGCGGRGTAEATSFIDNTNTRLVALADLFPDQLEAARNHFNKHQQAKGYPAIDGSQLFQGPDAYQQITASNALDFILIATPPYFHPLHLETVVAAGRHVYCEKPVAVDVPGAKHIVSIGEKAQGKLSLEVGFQLRSAPPYVELIRRIHGGALGRIGSGLAFYYCGQISRPEWPNASPEESRLRNWVWDRTLSGDIIVEQNIHVIDLCNWTLGTHPVRALGSGSRKLRSDAGDAWDNFNCVFIYPDDIQVSFGSTQVGKPAFDAGVNFFGAKGSSDAHYDHRVSISGEEAWDARLPGSGPSQFSVTGTFQGAIDRADAEKEKSFVESITSGQFHNQAEQGAISALTCMMGRTAAYTNKPVTWDDLMGSTEAWESGIDLEKLNYRG